MQFRNIWNLDYISLFNFLTFQFDGMFCFYTNQFDPSHIHAPSLWTYYYASIDGSNWFFAKVCAKAKCFYI
jgi:hypothetical protein